MSAREQGGDSGASDGGGTPSATPPALNASKRVSKRSAATPKRGLAPQKVQIVQVARRQLGMAEDVYRAMLRELGGVDSSTQLNQAGFAAVMDRFKQLGFRHSKPFEDSPGADQAAPAGMATAKQRRFIRGLWRQYSGSDDARALRRFLSNRFHVADVRFLTELVASGVIEGLKIMVARKAQAARADDNNRN